jgi:hypothetical protein
VFLGKGCVCVHVCMCVYVCGREGGGGGWLVVCVCMFVCVGPVSETTGEPSVATVLLASSARATHSVNVSSYNCCSALCAIVRGVQLDVTYQNKTELS